MPALDIKSRLPGTISLARSRSPSLRANQDDSIAHVEGRADDGTNEPAAQRSALLFAPTTSTRNGDLERVARLA
jgi:hypothetical protein